MKDKKGFELSLHAVVDLVLAAMAIIAITTIIAGVLVVLYSEEEQGQKSGVIQIISKIEQNEPEVKEDTIPVTGYLKDNFMMVAFSKDVNEIEGECQYGELHYHQINTMHGDKTTMTGGEKADMNIERPEKCDTGDEPACLCLCKYEEGWLFSDFNVNCVEGECYPFRENEGLEFKGGEDCDLPVIFPNKGNMYRYTLEWKQGHIYLEPNQKTNPATNE
ncbi:MAG: hypothetical protein ACOCQX_04365 [Candidatus Nanoarchaeia archaeon]